MRGFFYARFPAICFIIAAKGIVFGLNGNMKGLSPGLK